MASGAYNAATFTATAILPQMQGAMAATQDEISWTVTFNILVTAVFTPMPTPSVSTAITVKPGFFCNARTAN